MWVPRCIIAVISMLVLTATPAVVEGTCHCADVCPNYIRNATGGNPLCWFDSIKCDNAAAKLEFSSCAGYCACNLFGCNCEGCEQVAGGCGWTEQTHAQMDTEKEDVCADFHTFTSLSAEGKRDFLADKYCVDDDKVVVEDIYELLLNEVLMKLDDGSVLTCALFNKSYVDVSHLKLCKDKHNDGEL